MFRPLVRLVRAFFAPTPEETRPRPTARAYKLCSTVEQLHSTSVRAGSTPAVCATTLLRLVRAFLRPERAGGAAPGPPRGRRGKEAAMNTPEQDLRLTILNTLLTTPHRKLGDVWAVHEELVRKDPRFYVRLAAWYSDHGDVRDHKEMFVITLVLSTFPGHRDVGLALLRGLPPYEVVRVVDFIKGRLENKPARVKNGAAREAAAAPEKPAVFGLFRNPPRCLRTEVTRYLREREADASWFDSSVLVARKALKRLYAVLHVKPAGRAQRILFADDPPADSRVFALRQLARAADPEEQARAIVACQVPY